MNKKISGPFLTVSLLLLAICGYSQKLDLIVTLKADSIACKVDSITDDNIYYMMKFRSSWIHTQIPKTEVSEYKYDIIQAREYRYKPGTSIIDSSIPSIPASLDDVRRNSVYVGILSINYARMFPLGKATGLTLGGGLINMDAWGVVVESTVLRGGFKHFFETGIMGAYFPSPNGEPDNPESGDPVSAVTFRIGYRYQAPWGLLVRIAPNFILSTEDNLIFAALSLGYSF